MKYIQFLIVIPVLMICMSDLSGQCATGSFICNDTIQVSVDEMCEALISADIILEQPNEDCQYELRFFDEDDNERNVPGNILNVDHIGLLLKVKVLEAGVNNPNSCWGYIKVEDKIPAVINCPEFDPFSCLDSDQNDPGRTDEELAVRLRTYLGYLAALLLDVVVSFFSVQNRELLEQPFRLS